MNYSLRRSLYLGIVLLAFSAGCGQTDGAELAPTNLPIDPPSADETPNFLATEAVTTPEAAATQASIAEESASPDSPALDTSLYQHPGGMFQFLHPEDWSLVEESESSLRFEAPGGAEILVSLINTGLPLNGEAFVRFISAREANTFLSLDSYQEIERTIDLDAGSASVTKNLSLEDSQQAVLSYYRRFDQAVFSIDLWQQLNPLDFNAPQLAELTEGVTVDQDEAAKLSIYSEAYVFSGKDGLFSLQVPTSWAFEGTLADYTVIDTFRSPDQHALVQNVFYDDGEPLSNSAAGLFALELIRTLYAPDVIVTSDFLQADGKERLVWYSPRGGFSGTSIFENRGTTFFLLTARYDNAQVDLFQPRLNEILNTYRTSR